MYKDKPFGVHEYPENIFDGMTAIVSGGLEGLEQDLLLGRDRKACQGGQAQLVDELSR